jgi:tetratricopeptide (TPR) repeat protein
LVADFPTQPDYRRELAGLQLTLGSLQWSRKGPNTGPFEAVKKIYDDALTLCTKLTQDFPTVPEYRRELARCYIYQGRLYREVRRLAEADEAYQRGLELRAQLVADCPTVPRYRQELARTYNFHGRVLLQTGKPEDADRALRQALAVQEKLVADFPTVPDYKGDLSNTLANLGRLRRRQGQWEQARQDLERAVEQVQAALKPNPRQPVYRRSCTAHLLDLAEILLHFTDLAAVTRVAEEIPGIFPHDPTGYVKAARLLARCVPLAEQDSNGTTVQRQAQAEGYAERAVVHLRLAVDKGFRDFATCEKNPAFQALWSRDDFKALMKNSEKKAKTQTK